MKNQLCAVTSQGEGTARGLCASPESVLSTGYRPKRFLKLLRGLCSAICFALLGSTILYSQNLVTHNVADYGFGIASVCDSVAVGSGDQIEIRIGISDPVTDLMEFAIEFEVSDSVRFPVIGDFEFQNSWFDQDPEVILMEETRKVKVIGRQEEGKSGSGILIELTLEALEEGVICNKVVDHGGGILIVIEDIGFKQHGSSQHQALSVLPPVLYPNPCHDRLQIDWNGNAPVSLMLFNSQGTLVHTLEKTALQPGHWDLAHLLKGIYWVIAEDPHGRLPAQRLVIQ